ncbi:MAG: Gfo/Idh/MocA family oxidoreductase [Taibaiella sp.]|nr:Gfo/Idh/MocA family oxidoreductase [Taibaiella sp.]
MKNRILQIGAGSMGSRRLRDLSLREDVEIVLYDQREDRRERASNRFGIKTFDNMASALEWGPEALIISTPPDMHHQYIEIALEKGYSHFCEADMWTADYDKILRVSREKRMISAPSFTSYFLPITTELKRIVDKELGRLYCYQFYLCFYLPTWHPGEGDEFYANHRSTSGGREVVPFEMSLLNYLFGIPVDACGTVARRGLFDMDSEDTWCLQVKLDNGGTGQMIVIMTSPYVKRGGWFAGVNGFVEFDIISGKVHRKFPVSDIDEVLETGSVKEIIETAYFNEINTFVNTLQGKAEWPFNYKDNAISTSTLAAAEKSAISGRVEKNNPDFQPAELPDGYEKV